MIVYTIGTVDYDNRAETPHAVFSTLEAAKTYVADRNVEWAEEDDGSWYGRGEYKHWEIARFEVDEASAKNQSEGG